VTKYNLSMSSMKNPLIVSSPGGEMKTGHICPQVKINIMGVDFLANLVVLKSWGIDVILGMDWHSKQNRSSTFSSEDRRTTESARAPSTDDKWRSLKAFRRAKGLCQYFAEKWTKEHKCADNVHLNVVQELMAILQTDEEDEEFDSGPSNGESSQLYLTLSIAALSGVPAPKTLCLSGAIQQHKISILVDSGSSHSFISAKLASQLDGVVPLQPSLPVKVANGQKPLCSA
jgi:hypothetical protein